MTAPLAFLDFDYTEDDQGHGSFDAMAAVAPAQWRALHDEVVAVLDWAQAGFGAPGPVGEGAEWDLELQGVREVATTLVVGYAPGAGLRLQDGPTGAPRTTLSVTLSGTPAFCEAFRQAFGS